MQKLDYIIFLSNAFVRRNGKNLITKSKKIQYITLFQPIGLFPTVRLHKFKFQHNYS